MIDRIIEIFQRAPRVAILMSGQGSNAEVILQNRDQYPNIHFVSVITDNPQSRAHSLSCEYGIDYQFVAGSVKSQELRIDYFKRLGKILDEMQIDVLIYAGFMKVAPAFFVEKYPGINIHPADLTIVDENGYPRYRGIRTIEAAIENGETYIASTVHVVEDKVDCGAILAVSKKLHLDKESKMNTKDLHEKLKLECEHTCFPYVLKKLSEGSLGRNEKFSLSL